MEWKQEAQPNHTELTVCRFGTSDPETYATGTDSENSDADFQPARQADRTRPASSHDSPDAQEHVCFLSFIPLSFSHCPGLICIHPHLCGRLFVPALSRSIGAASIGIFCAAPCPTSLLLLGFWIHNANVLVPHTGPATNEFAHESLAFARV
jgi:hypothetical protein